MELKKPINDSLKIAILSDLVFEFANNNSDSAYHYWQQQKLLAQKLNNPLINANVYNDLAVIQYYKGAYNDALDNNMKALAIRERFNNKNLLISSLNKIGNIHQELGHFTLATQYQLRVLSIAQELNNSSYISLTLNNLSYIYQHVHKFDSALHFSKRQLQMATTARDTMQLGISSATLLGIYESLKMPDTALKYGYQAINFLKRSEAIVELSALYNDIGYLYRNLGNIDSGEYYYIKAFQLAQELGNTTDVALYATNLGGLYVDKKQLKVAYTYLYQAQSLVDENYKPSFLKTLYHGWMQYYLLSGNSDSALHYAAKWVAISDQLYSAESTAQVNELMVKFDAERKEQSIRRLADQNTIQRLEIQKRNVLIVVVITIFILLSFLGILLYNRRKLKDESAYRKLLLQQRQQAARDMLKAEELERQRIARELHDGLGQMFSTVKMNLSGIADRVKLSNETERSLLHKTLLLVDESCKEVRTIAHQMMPNVLLRMGLSSAVQEFIDKIDDASLQIRLETYGLNQPLDAQLESVLYRVIQECVNNVIKHAKATNLDIQLHKDENSVTLTVEDNGVGFDMRKIDENNTAGLKSVKARIAYLGGKVDYDAAPGKGTLVAVYIPINNQANDQ